MSDLTAISALGGEVHFSADGDWITLEGKVFECGTWPDRDFTFTEADADAAVAAFSGAPLEAEHIRTIFDGKLGRLERIERRGKDLWGQVRVPAFVDSCWAEAGRKISAVFNTTTKRLVRAGLVLDPQITDATLQAAQAAFTRRVPPGPSEEQTMSFLDKLQQLLDEAKAGGAAAFSAQPNATTPAPTPAPVTPPSAPATPWVPPTSPAPPAAPVQPAPAPVPSGPTPSPAGSEALAAMQAKIAEIEERERQALASAEIQRAVYTGQVLPHEIATFTAQLARAMADDAAHPAEIAFSVNGKETKTSRADLVRAQIAARKPTSVLTNMGEVLFNRAANAEEDANDPLTPAGAEKTAREFAARMNGSRPQEAK